MKYIIIAFKSRNTLQKFVHFLKMNNIFSKIVNTPHAISSSCGLSAKTDYSNYGFIVSALNKGNIGDLLGVYLVSESKFTNHYQRLI